MTKTHKFISAALLGAVALGSAQFVGSQDVSAKELRLAHFSSPKHPMDRLFMRPWTKKVASMSAGTLSIKIFPGGKLGKGPRAQFKRAVDGIADISWGLQGYTSKIFKRTAMVELPGVASNSNELVKKMWNAHKLLAPEYKKVKLLAMWVGEAPIFMSRKKPIRTLADLKGMKIRTPSANQSRWLKALGATPVSMPITQVYRALETGRVDALLVPPSVIKSFKIGEVAKHYTTGLAAAFGRSPFFLVMNKKAWAGLSDSQKILITNTTGAKWSAKATAIYMKAGAKGLDSVRNTGKHKVYAFSKAERAKMKSILLKARAKYIEQLEKGGVPAKAILAAMNAGS
ncbi:MAG: C4-dicarboxylate ABC transporter substrate-binding protein [Rhodospirillaceae bacterium]|nr:C4-dicarboxylate ABC transporter substrate-binding protein [Rhodospirillaceae bacterium]|tara:strand:- start:16378 stop:17406 length:1029 start_codon:yes stop_codon:yes gene_type:complete